MNSIEQEDTAGSADAKIGFGKSIFGGIWALWAILLFVSTMILFFIPFLLFSYFRPDPLKTKRFILYSRVWMKIFLTLVGCPLKVVGRQYFAKNETYIVLCNHNALIDIPVSSPGIPGGNKTIAKIEMAKIPLFGLLYRTGSVLVDRKDSNSRRDSFAKMKDVLSSGLHMCIYPEGTRNKTGQPLKSFHDGAFRLAIATKRSIIPAIIFNSKKAMPPGKSFFLFPAPLYLHFLKPVDVVDTDSVESLKEKLFILMTQYYIAGNNGTFSKKH